MGFRLRVAIVALFMGAIMIAVDMGDFVVTCKEPVGYYELDVSEIKAGVYVEDEIFLVMDNVASEVTTTNSTEKESAREYALPLLVIDGEELYIDQIMGMKVTERDDYDLIDQIIDDSVAWWNDETGTVDIGNNVYAITGKIRKMKKDEKNLMIEYVSEVFEISESESEDYVLPYVLEPVSRERVLITLAIGLAAFLAGAGLLAWEIMSRRNQG